jgi:hypothetical protein
MGDFLPTFYSSIDDYAKAALITGGTAVFLGQLGCQGHHSTQPLSIISLNIEQGGNVVLGHDQQMQGCRRVYIMEGDEFVIFINFFGRNLATGDLTEKAIVAHR